MSISKNFRIRLQKDFDNIFKNGLTVSCSEITLKYLAKNIGPSRLAVIISKKTAKKASARNILRRQVKEIMRPKLSEFCCLDLVFILKTPILEKNFLEIKDIVEKLLKKIKK